MVKFVQKVVFITSSLLLTACVTQNFDKDTPVIEQNSSDQELAMGRVTLGLGYLNMGNTTQAKYNLEKAKRFDPNLIEVHTAFAHYFETVDEPELAEQSFEKALSIKSNDANTLNNYGVFLCRQENYLKAEQQFLKAIAIPSYLLVSKSYENLASCQLKAGDFEKAERYLSKAITHSPNSSSALFQMIELEYAMGNYKKARRYTQKFEKVTRRFRPASLALSLKVYQKLGNQKTARNYGSMLVSMYPESWEAKQYILNGLERTEADDLAEKYQEMKLKNNSKKAKKRVIVLSPHNKPTTQANQQKTVEAKTEVVKEASKPENKVLPTAAILVDSAADSVGGTNVTIVDANSPQVSAMTKAVVASEIANDDEIITTDVATGSIAEDNGINKALADETVLASNVTSVVNNDDLVTDTTHVTEAATSSSDNIQDSIETSVEEFKEDITSSISENSLEESILPEETSLPREFHVVVKGENLYGISVKYNTQIKALRRWNSLDENSKLHIGDIIFVAEPLVEETTDE
ncbi:MAG: type IV pilus biogenesis/stability protein PilW [Colwellia sp.]|nr:type IV pilus biogenesis/stability protein PilW [Colwellia sp.]